MNTASMDGLPERAAQRSGAYERATQASTLHHAPRRAGPLTDSDCRRIRAQVLGAGFVNWNQLSSEWGLPPDKLKTITKGIRKQ